MSNTVREIIDQYLSLEWCKDNIVVPLEIERDKSTGGAVVIIAIGNFIYLASIGEFIKKRFEASGMTCQFVEREVGEINRIIDDASKENVAGRNDEANEYQYADDAILSALASSTEEKEKNEEVKFEFEDSDEIVVETSIPDLAVEILGSQIQKAAAQILISTCRSNVSDIHIEPWQDHYKVRVRRDGLMQNYVSMPRSAGIKLTTCLKIMSKMDAAERLAHQDGKILRRFEGQVMEFRCSTAPAKHGEKMVLRILNNNIDFPSLDILIDNEETRCGLRSTINEANGIIIFAGPTGSGKSTTLASALREIDSGELNIVTAEDPIEYDLGGNIQQFPVIRAKGQTFANLLRTFLRQDPDVILIAEIRDTETTKCLFDAAETGHLMFSTLHVESCAQAIRYFQYCNIPPHKLYMANGGILAQKLLRRVCPSCSTERPCTADEMRLLGLPRASLVRNSTALSAKQKDDRKKEGTLCERCGGSGYQGRIAAYEFIAFTPTLMDSLSKTSSLDEIQSILEQSGMKSLLDYSRDHVLSQKTTVAEVCRVLHIGGSE